MDSDNSRDDMLVPDPSQRTSENILREVESLKELVFTRLDAMDKAISLSNENFTRVPTDTDKQIAHLKALHDEKFESVQKQFEERDVRNERSAQDTKTAVDAALQAAKEAVVKSETSMIKQLDQIMQTIQKGNENTDEKINDVKDRLNRSEGQGEGKQTSGNLAIAIIGIVVAFAGLAFGMFMALKK